VNPTGVINEGLALLNVVDKAKNADLYKQLGDYITTVQQLQKDKDALAAKVLDLSDQLRFKDKVQYIAGSTFVEGLDQEICPACADIEHKPVRLQDRNLDGRGMKATCPKCKTTLGSRPPITRQQAEQTAARLAAG
jgi:hypothetical protein